MKGKDLRAGMRSPTATAIALHNERVAMSGGYRLPVQAVAFHGGARANNVSAATVSLGGDLPGAVGIASVEVVPGTETVYNFAVEEEHNYFVSTGSVLVHNQEAYTGPVDELRRIEAARPQAGSVSEAQRVVSDNGFKFWQDEVTTETFNVYVKDAEGNLVAVPNTIAHTDTFDLLGLLGEDLSTVNGVPVRHGDVIMTDLRSGKLGVATNNPANGQVDLRQMVSENPAVFLSINGVNNDMFDAVHTSNALLKKASEDGLGATFHIFNASGKEWIDMLNPLDGGADEPEETLRSMIQAGAWRQSADGNGTIVAHSGGARILEKTLAQNDLKVPADVYAFAGYHDAVPIDSVESWTDFYDPRDEFFGNEARTKTGLLLQSFFADRTSDAFPSDRQRTDSRYLKCVGGPAMSSKCNQWTVGIDSAVPNADQIYHNFLWSYQDAFNRNYGRARGMPRGPYSP